MKYIRFQDIPELVRDTSYKVNVGLDYLAQHVARYVIDYGLDISPPFQRAHVWTREQQIAYVEYFLRGPMSGTTIYLNAPNWMRGNDSWCVLVDGKQRLQALLSFLNNEIQIFGSYYHEYTDNIRLTRCSILWAVNTLPTYEDCLRWYLEINAMGTPHSAEEIARVHSLLASKEPYMENTREVILANAGLDRDIFKSELEKMRIEKEKSEQYLANPPPPAKNKSNRKGKQVTK